MRSVLCLLAACMPSTIAYTLVDDYMKGNFYNKFSFWNFATDGVDPAAGTVNYLPQSDALSQGLIVSRRTGDIYIGVDYKTKNPLNGRASVRLTSKKSYDVGTLFVADITHMPGGICGTWPALWTTAASKNWPQEGEIDIIEQVNDATVNKASLHVSGLQGICTVNTPSTSNKFMSAKPSPDWPNCIKDVDRGCSADDSRASSYGTGFNDAGGGIYAMEWTQAHVNVWFFPRNSIPSDKTTGPLGSHPDPAKWALPMTSFQGNCDMDAHVQKQSIIINTDFCGLWGGKVWPGSSCAKSTGAATCEEHVKNNAAAFQNAYWSFKALAVYR